MPAKKPNEEWRIIILESELGLIGLCVEGVGEILSFAEEQIEIAANQDCIKGTIQLNEQLVIVMNTLSKVRSLSLELADH
jgi:chemotaxis signal transduction protein